MSPLSLSLPSVAGSRHSICCVLRKPLTSLCQLRPFSLAVLPLVTGGQPKVNQNIKAELPKGLS